MAIIMFGATSVSLSRTKSRRRSGPPGWLTCCLAVSTVAFQGCSSVPARNGVPEAMVERATISGMPLARWWGDELPADLDQRLSIVRDQLETAGDEDAHVVHHYLSVSGGGANGAFGAGLLKGWTESGTRPEFWIVTGVSTGALIAPFAFLGSDYDDELERFYTTTSTADILKQRNILAGLTGDALGDSTPLRELLARIIDEAFVVAIGAEYRRGRRLWISTTNLDVQRPVIWNIGFLADINTPESRQLIRDVMLASASIPGVFPPVRIQVEADGEPYDELHVDGGTSSQVFLYPAELDFREAIEAAGVVGEQSVYVIRNALPFARWEEVSPKLFPVSRASLSSLIRTQGIGDLFRIYVAATRDNINFNLAFIPSSFDLVPEEAFDPTYMRALFDLAYDLSRDGYDWVREPIELRER